MESTDRDQRLQDIWCNRLREELEECKAPVLATLSPVWILTVPLLC